MMDISKEAIEKIEQLATSNQVIEIDGKKYSNENFRAIEIDRPKRPCNLEGSTMTSLVQYIKANVEKISKEDLMIQVHTHNHVSLIERFTGEEKRRTTFYVAKLDESLPVFRFDQYMPVEDFIIKARALMQPTADLDTIIAIVSKVVNQSEITAADDGISQAVAVKKGVSGALTTDTQTKGMYELRPYRTFRELQQPACRFILRLKPTDGGLPQVALFDAEGGIWKYQAMLDVKSYLDEQLEDQGIPVLA